MARSLLGVVSKTKKLKARASRALILFLVFTIAFSLVQPGAGMALAESANARKFDTNFKLDPLKSKDTQDTTSLTQGTGGPLTLPTVKDPKGHKYEDTGKRTAFTSTYVNNDGTKTMEYSVNQQNYKEGSSWKKIDNSLDAVTEKAPDPTLWQTITGTQPKAPEPEQFKGKAGTMSADIQPLADGITMNVAGKIIVMKPVGAAARVVKATKAGVSVGRQLYASKNFGISSKLFGNARFGLNGAGRWNNYGRIKAGWSHRPNGYATFRIGFRAFNKARHIHLAKGPRLW